MIATHISRGTKHVDLPILRAVIDRRIRVFSASNKHFRVNFLLNHSEFHRALTRRTRAGTTSRC